MERNSYGMDLFYAQYRKSPMHSRIPYQFTTNFNKLCPQRMYMCVCVYVCMYACTATCKTVLNSFDVVKAGAETHVGNFESHLFFKSQYVCVYVCMYMCMHVCVYVCIYVRMCAHIYTSLCPEFLGTVVISSNLFVVFKGFNHPVRDYAWQGSLRLTLFHRKTNPAYSL